MKFIDTLHLILWTWNHLLAIQAEQVLRFKRFQNGIFSQEFKSVRGPSAAVGDRLCSQAGIAGIPSTSHKLTFNFSWHFL